MTGTTKAVKAIFIVGLRNAHAMEAQAAELLKRQIGRLTDYPGLVVHLEEHLEETHRQQTRLEQILGAHEASSSTLKDAAMSLIGNMAAIMHMPADDEVLKNSFASFAFENYEVAAYKSLLTLAETLGDQAAIGPLRQSLEEEQAMAAWLDAHLESVTKRYLKISGNEAA